MVVKDISMKAVICLVGEHDNWTIS